MASPSFKSSRGFESTYSRRVVHDQMNSSHAKSQNIFTAKRDRYSKNRASYSEQAAYPPSSTQAKHSANQGYGIKGDFYKPAPDKYSVISLFDLDSQKIKASTFSLGREEIKFRKIPVISQNPGPGTYQTDEGENHRTKLYSLGGRTVNPFVSKAGMGVPGPDSYNIQGLSRTGFYFSTKHPGTKATVFSPPTCGRFEGASKYPGPGEYKVFSDFDNVQTTPQSSSNKQIQKSSSQLSFPRQKSSQSSRQQLQSVQTSNKNLQSNVTTTPGNQNSISQSNFYPSVHTQSHQFDVKAQIQERVQIQQREENGEHQQLQQQLQQYKKEQANLMEKISLSVSHTFQDEQPKQQREQAIQVEKQRLSTSQTVEDKNISLEPVKYEPINNQLEGGQEVAINAIQYDNQKQ